MLLRVTQDQELLEEKRGNETALEERKHVFWVAGPKLPPHHHPRPPSQGCAKCWEKRSSLARRKKLEGTEESHEGTKPLDFLHHLWFPSQEANLDHLGLPVPIP